MNSLLLLTAASRYHGVPREALARLLLVSVSQNKGTLRDLTILYHVLIMISYTVKTCLRLTSAAV